MYPMPSYFTADTVTVKYQNIPEGGISWSSDWESMKSSDFLT